MIRDARWRLCTSYSSIAARLCYFWLDPKVTKRSRQQQHFFLPHWAFALHIRQHHREAFPCPAVRTRIPPLQQRNEHPFLRRAGMCCLISPGIGLLSGKVEKCCDTAQRNPPLPLCIPTLAFRHHYPDLSTTRFVEKARPVRQLTDWFFLFCGKKKKKPIPFIRPFTRPH